MGIEHADIQHHAHRNKEQPQQQPFKRLDGNFQFVAVFALRQQHPGNEGAERHRQAKRFHKQRRAEHQQQRRGSEDLAHAGSGDIAEQRPQQETAADQHAAERRHLERDLRPVVAGAAGAGQNRDQRQRRDHRHILEQQYREAELPPFVAVHALLAHQLQRHGGGRHRQADAADHRRLPGEVRQVQQRAQHRRGDQHLAGAGAEDRTPQLPQLAGVQLQADDEHQEHHAQLGEVQDLVDVANEAQSPGADSDAGDQIAQHRADPQATGDRHRHHRGEQEQ